LFIFSILKNSKWLKIFIWQIFCTKILDFLVAEPLDERNDDISCTALMMTLFLFLSNYSQNNNDPVIW
jgi:hypothetical protein